MRKKRYVKPEIREESYVLTVRAYITTTSIAVQDIAQNTQIVEQLANTDTSVAAQQIVERISEVVTRR